MACIVLPVLLATSCASVDVPGGSAASIPTIPPPTPMYRGLNETPSPITRVRLGRDVLMPQMEQEDPFPDVDVGPYELRNETLANALQLILGNYNVSLAFDTDEGLKKRITISDLHGRLGDVVHEVCAVADLYCQFRDGTLTVKKTETFVVDLPPINVDAAAASSGSIGSSGASTNGTSTSGTTQNTGTSTSATSSSGGGASAGATTNDAYKQIADGLKAVLQMSNDTTTAPQVTIDNATRVLIYSATQRSSRAAKTYFERLRKNTALIIFETHIWEVTLNNDNQTGINWSSLAAATGNFAIKSTLSNSLSPGVGTASPITITPSYTGGRNYSANFILQFISEHGAVKTVSQPQITVLSGSKASLVIGQQDNYVASTTTTAGTVTTNEQSTLQTGTVNTGLSMNIASGWDNSTVYGAITITLQDLVRIDTFTSPNGSSTVQLPHTTTRSLSTEIRVRPGDSILIGGLVSQTDQLTSSGPGFMKPLFATDRTVNKTNTELVFLLRPRVVVFVPGTDSDTPRITDAPHDGMQPPQPDGRDEHTAVGNDDAPDNASDNAPEQSQPLSGKDAAEGAALPAGISPEAFAPQDPSPPPAAPEKGMPVSAMPVAVQPTGGGNGDNGSGGANR
ncbi:MAG: hypothetical protein KGL10_02440 [Alphaproteobacteria bacterium]|nr:hypothetical protein [Alphaproteobacteria bacterium]MDE2336147.1 hypothetical protein [Alphaproteobacteria bacterium]